MRFQCLGIPGESDCLCYCSCCHEKMHQLEQQKEGKACSESQFYVAGWSWHWEPETEAHKHRQGAGADY